MDYISGSKAVVEDTMSPADILSSWGKKTGKEKTLVFIFVDDLDVGIFLCIFLKNL